LTHCKNSSNIDLGTRLVLDVVAAHAALVIPAPGDAEAQRGHAGQVDGDGRRDGVSDHGQGLGDDIARPVAGADAHRGAEAVAGVEVIAVEARPGDRAAQSVGRPVVGRVGEGQAEQTGQGVGGGGSGSEDTAPHAVVDGVRHHVGQRRGTGQRQGQLGKCAIQDEGLVFVAGDIARPILGADGGRVGALQPTREVCLPGIIARLQVTRGRVRPDHFGLHVAQVEHVRLGDDGGDGHRLARLLPQRGDGSFDEGGRGRLGL
jgi:hypothetical protein